MVNTIDVLLSFVHNALVCVCVCVHLYENKTSMRFIPILGNAIKQVKNEVNKKLKT